MAPPPLVMRHAGPQADLAGDARVQLVLAVNAGVLSVDPGVGLALQVSHQTDETWKVGGNLGFGHSLEHFGENKNNHPTWLLALRGFARAHTGVDGHAAGEGGLGVGYTGNETVYLTADIGGTFGGELVEDADAGRLVAYAAPTVAISVPVVEGQPIFERPLRLRPAGAPALPPTFAELAQDPEVKKVYPKPTWFVFLNAGMAHEIPSGDGAYGYSLELHQFFAFDERDGSFNVGLSTAGSTLIRD